MLPDDLIPRATQVLLPRWLTPDERSAWLAQAFYLAEPRLYNQLRTLDGQPIIILTQTITALLEAGCLPNKKAHALAQLLSSVRIIAPAEAQTEIDRLVPLLNTTCADAAKPTGTQTVPAMPTSKPLNPLQSYETPLAERTPTVFISYSHQDNDFAEQLIGDLQNGGHAVWIDKMSIKGGSEWVRSIADGISNSYAFVSVVSAAANVSRWVQREYLYADNLGKPIYPVMAEPTDVPFQMIDRQVIVMHGDYPAGLTRLLGTLPAPRAYIPPKPTIADVPAMPPGMVAPVGRGIFGAAPPPPPEPMTPAPARRRDRDEQAKSSERAEPDSEEASSALDDLRAAPPPKPIAPAAPLPSAAPQPMLPPQSRAPHKKPALSGYAIGLVGVVTTFAIAALLLITTSINTGTTAVNTIDNPPQVSVADLMLTLPLMAGAVMVLALIYTVIVMARRPKPAPQAEPMPLPAEEAADTAPAVMPLDPRALELLYINRVAAERIDAMAEMGSLTHADDRVRVIPLGQRLPQKDTPDWKNAPRQHPDAAGQSALALRRAVLMGDDRTYGMSALWAIAQHLNTRATADPTQPIPMVLDMTRWRSGDGLEQFIADEIGDLSAHLPALLYGRRIALLMDGLSVLSEARLAQIEVYINRHTTLMVFLDMSPIQ